MTVKGFKYIDNTTLFQAAGLSSAVRHITTGEGLEELRNLAVDFAFQNIIREAEKIGMKINKKKTQLLIVSPSNGYLTSAVMGMDDGEKIESVREFKLVGFHFGSKPNVAAHVGAMKAKFRRRVWMLYHLWRAGFRDMVLFRLYCCYVRSVLEYCSPVYHPLLSAGQTVELEKMNRQAIRICFGFDEPVERVMERTGIETLLQRRTRRMDSFIRKSLTNPRFQHVWFPLRDMEGLNLRRPRLVQEARASTLRMFRSPLAYMRRRANELDLGT